jgi:hypothetical protein
MDTLSAKSSRTFILITFFAIAMGFLEAIVVVYLRELYYPKGFVFPLSLLPAKMVTIEWTREIATIIMLVTIGMIAGKNRLQAFLYFLFSFAIWDIIYYVALKLFLNWPDSLFTWDILFLIPITWIGPVLAPVICSITMIGFAIAGIICLEDKGYRLSVNRMEWALLISGSLVIFYTFISDFLKLIIHYAFVSGGGIGEQNTQLLQAITNFVPVNYNWDLFTLGEILIVYAIVHIYRRVKAGR